MKRIVLFANSVVAIEVTQVLIFRGQCCGMVLPHYEHDGNRVLIQMTQQFNIPLLVSDNSGFDEKLSHFLSSIKPDIGVVLTFPFKISKTCLSIPKKGIYNFHFALLPKYRGADPIFWQIRNGEAFGGISVHKMTNELDAGSVLLIEKLVIEVSDTYGGHWQKLQKMTVSVFDAFLKLIHSSSFESKLKKQNKDDARYWSKPTLEDLRINWKKMAASEIRSLVNASNPTFQGAVAFLENKEVRLFEVELSELNQSDARQAGSLILLENSVYVTCADSKYLRLNVVMFEYGVMSTQNFHNFLKERDTGNLHLS